MAERRKGTSKKADTTKKTAKDDSQAEKPARTAKPRASKSARGASEPETERVAAAAGDAPAAKKRAPRKQTPRKSKTTSAGAEDESPYRATPTAAATAIAPQPAAVAATTEWSTSSSAPEPLADAIGSEPSPSAIAVLDEAISALTEPSSSDASAATAQLPAHVDELLAGEYASPHSILGAHPATVDGESGVIIRAMIPNAERAEAWLSDGRVVQLERVATGLSDLYSGFVADASLPLDYRFRFYYPDGAVWDRGDPYRFLPTIGDVDLHLFNEGTHRQLWRKLGAHCRTVDGVSGVSFAVWAPNARRVSVVGDFCGWDGRIFPMRSMGSSGVWEVFLPDIHEGALYKFEMLTREKAIRVKSDPFAAKMEQAPGTACIVQNEDTYQWNDSEWCQARGRTDLLRSPMAIYEVHLGSWARVPEEDNRTLSYREIAPQLAAHVQKLGFTHVELLPIMEHPFYGSWGYQVSGYFAPTSRYGRPDDFRFLVDTLHQHGIGVILDWVPAHFPKDDYALRRYDGTALYEHEDPRLGEHPDWGTLIFNYGRNEVRNFLIANALYWIDEFHVDGLRVDAVASMLYLDYSRKEGEWLPNRHGGRENLDAIEFLKQFNDTIRHECPGAVTIAEESTAWPGVTTPVADGGLGFTFKWNMGWMHDTLSYFSRDPVHRRFHHDRLTFAMLYEYSERFIMPLSHDEVVHLKGSLFNKMPGDDWQKLANLRLLLAYMFTRPGKKLVFMGTEVAPWSEWSHDFSLDWHLRDDPSRHAFERYVTQLATVYRQHAAFWADDPSWDGFRWIDVADRDNSVLSYVRRAGDDHAVVILNLTPVPRERYRIGVPSNGRYRRVLSTDDQEWGGSGFGAFHDVTPDAAAFHGYPQSVEVTLPPLGALVLVPDPA